MNKYGGSVVFLSGNAVLAKVFVCEASQISEAEEKFTRFIADLGIPESLVIDKSLNTIKSPNNKPFIGAFATFDKHDGFKADFVILYTRDKKKFAEVVTTLYASDPTETTVLVESMDIKLLSEF